MVVPFILLVGRVIPQCENIIDTILFVSRWLGIAHYNMILAQICFQFLVIFFFFFFFLSVVVLQSLLSTC